MKQKRLYLFLVLFFVLECFGLILRGEKESEAAKDTYISLTGELDTSNTFTEEDQKEDEPPVLEASKIYAQGAILMDGCSGRVLWAKNGDEKKPNASTTKILTCILALEQGDFSGPVEVSSYAASMPSVKLHMKKGEHYKLEDLLYSLMLESHNDSAVAIAEHVAGSVEQFSNRMNEKAKEIGATNSFFITPNGLDQEAEWVKEDGSQAKIEHGTTPLDLAKIMRYCIMESPKKEAFLEITQQQSYSFHNLVQNEEGDWKEGERTFSCQNHNALLQLLPGTISGKTGYTAKAGYCYVGAIEKNDRPYIVALLGCGWPNHKNYKWEDSKKLFQYGIDHYREVKPDLAIAMPQLQVLQGKADTEDFFTDTTIIPQVDLERLQLLLAKEEKLTYELTLKEQLTAPVEKGEKIGTLLLRLQDSEEEITWQQEYPIYADRTIDRIAWQDIWGYLCKRYVTM